MTTVNVQVTDSSGQVWANGTVSAQLQTSFGQLLNVPAVQSALSSNGSASLSLTPNISINPAGSQWLLTVCPAATAPCFSQPVTISGSTQNVSVSPPPIVLNLGTAQAATLPIHATAYNSSEIVGAQIGSIYYDLTQQQLMVLTALPNTWQGVGSSQYATVNVVTYGADPTGVRDSTTAIQNAINAVNASGGGVVLFPANSTFLVSNSTATGEYGILTIYSNITLQGLDQNTSVIKCANGVQRLGANWNFFFYNLAPSNPLTKVVFRTLTFDHNGTNNLVPVGQPGCRNAALFAAYAHDVTIDSCTFVNNAGQQTLAFGANINPQSCQRIHIRNNLFHNGGLGVPGNINQNDHSSVYLQADDSELINNTAYNDTLPSGTTTAFEMHTRRARIQSNTIDSYYTAFNLVATVTDFADNLIQNNQMYNVNIGTYLWQTIAFKFVNNRIDNNRIVLASGNEFAGIWGSTNLLGSPQNLEITNNTISQLGVLTGNNLRTAGVYLLAGTDITVSGNKIFNLSGRGCDLFGTTTRMAITNNDIFDVGQGGNSGGYTQGIAFHTGGTASNFEALSNRIYNVDAHAYITTGVYLSGIINTVSVLNNVISVATELDTSAWTGSGLFFISSAPKTATSATIGSNGAVPAQVAGYLIMNIGGINYKLPYFNN